ncbi:alpha-mannosidase [Sulfolobus sp. A20]|uniref:alpha-mannosidase n=2 Tax=Sulfolobaceae TaxID=118883 RepID=UPI000845D9F2|nr:alpha-mannosidase [Sulfolobus sp. A20]TRM77320.1 alpha-mannosidase [Sulfolobus sp. A20-N-F8]TRM79496.1 alpha-mannosidase [Sulfolobus sp. B5]TRM89041.1 alpha-mannosidase [Sulfolobus sp. C3]TRN00218.1 alpha-mannosidase [Sulfolobus sp. F1]AOL16495.1 alpha-mannosidase [Sulfolobus sp. A20]
MRTFSELEARIVLILASSFKNLKELRWKYNNSEPFVEVEGNGKSSYLVIIDHRGSGLVRLDGKPYFELDAYHTLIPIPKGKHVFNINLSNYMDFGEKIDPSPGLPFYTELDLNAFELYIYGDLILDLLRDNNIEREIKDDLAEALTKGLREAYFESVSKDQIYIASKFVKTSLDLNRMYKSISDDEVYAQNENSEKYVKALNVLRDELRKLVSIYGKRGKLIGVGHAHIDTAWLWPFDETRRKVIRTFATMLTLLDRYDFHYIQSASIYYEWVKEDYPELFERIKQKVKEGKWEIGALYVESDTNMVSGESLARHFLYSQRFYLENFDRLAEVLWLPDTFGFTASLPQIAKLGGVKAFATHKVFWNDTNKFPYNVFNWVAPNGEELPSIAFGNGKGGYNSDFSSSSVLQQWQNWNEKNQPMLYSFGYGDGGGGPNEIMLIKANAINDIPILPKVTLNGLSEMLNEIKPINKWRGELYLETHRGVLTSHSKMKLLNRKAEILLREAEIWSTIAGNYDHNIFRRLWKTVLKNQFHDVLPGSAIREVYEVAYKELEEVIIEAERITQESISKIVGKGEDLVVFNSLNWEREEYIDKVKVRVPPLGYTKLNPVDVKDTVKLDIDEKEYIIENRYFRIRVSKSGEILSLNDKEVMREVIKEPSNSIVFYENIPGWADAWDIEKGYKETSFKVKASSSEVIEKGPTVVTIKFTYSFRRSTITQLLKVYADYRRIDFVTTLKMKDRELLVKTWFYFDLNVDRAVSDIPFGVVERFTWSNTSWDKARFEVPIQKFVDMSEDNYGVAILNDGKYGVSLEGNSIGLSLSKTPIFPDPNTDLDEVTFTYALYPHLGDWKRGEVLKRAYELNVPLRVIKGNGTSTKSFVKIDGPLMLESIKVSEDDNGSIILRLYEYANSRGEATIEFPYNVEKVESLDLIELNQIPRDILIEGNKIRIKYKNRDILTIKVRFSK